MEVDAPNNYAGAIVFWAYILAALYCTAIVLRTINSARGVRLHGEDKQPGIPSFLVFLAISSFATLSYHMLNVLILSYNQWAISHKVPVPDGLFGPGSYLGPERTPILLWKWSVTSTLFQDFGKAIMADKPRYLIAASGLWTTFYMAPFMGVEGRKAKIPNLWAFFCLLNILPTSFSQTLFYIMLSIQPQQPSGNAVRLSRWSWWYTIAIAYAQCLYSLSSAKNTWLVPIILAARLLILLPLFLPLTEEAQPNTGSALDTLSEVPKLYAFNHFLAQLFLGLHVAMVHREQGIASVIEALQSHPAVKALGYDLFHSVLAFWYWKQKTDSESSDGEKKTDNDSTDGEKKTT